MSRPKYEPRELEIIGENPSFLPGIVPGTPIYNRPITNRENIRLLVEGKRPYWIPQSNFLCDEVQGFRPRIFTDNIADHKVFDGGAPYEYQGNEVVSWFGLKWEFVEAIDGSTVHPGNPIVKDINHWEDYITFPDPEQMDWDQMEQENVDYLNTGNYRQLGFLCGFWERLMALMDVENAAIAMIDEDQQEGVKQLFDRLADFYIDLIDRVVKRCPIDSVLIHDDWAHQNGLFFSRETHRKMILPYLKRVVDFCHSKGLFYEHHCCGKAGALVPEMLACGVDLWSGQSLNDQYALAHQYKDEAIIFGITHPKLPENASKEEIRDIARQFVEDYRDCKITISMDDDPPYSIFELRNQDFLDAVYEFSRIAYQDEE